MILWSSLRIFTPCDVIFMVKIVKTRLSSSPADLQCLHQSCWPVPKSFLQLSHWPKHFINDIVSDKQVEQWCEKFSWTTVRCKMLTAGHRFGMRHRQGESQVNSLSALPQVLSLLNMDPSNFRTNPARFAQKQLHWAFSVYEAAELSFHSL